MTASNDNSTRKLASEIEVIPYRQALRYPSSPDLPLPERPHTEIRGTGLFGLGQNRQDLAHDQHLRELKYVATEAAYAEQLAVAAEVSGLTAARDGMRKAEEIVYATLPDSVAGMLAADIASDIAARLRGRHGRLMEALDAETLNILHRR